MRRLTEKCLFPFQICTCGKCITGAYNKDPYEKPTDYKDFVTKDSGKRRHFDTGAQRDVATNKGRYDLISPIVMDRLAKLMERGAVKYDDRNWEKGMPLHVYVDSGLRHIYKFLEGHRDEDHLIAAIWNFSALLHIEEMIKRGKLSKDLNDLPNYIEEDNESK